LHAEDAEDLQRFAEYDLVESDCSVARFGQDSIFFPAPLCVRVPKYPRRFREAGMFGERAAGKARGPGQRRKEWLVIEARAERCARAALAPDCDAPAEFAPKRKSARTKLVREVGLMGTTAIGGLCAGG
jgi:hypothetical protein